MSRLDDLLARPADQRLREYQYRFAQSAVFGLPVLVLQWVGRSLGGPEADRWVAVFQALLTGWVVYVGAAGMLFESVLRLGRRQFAADLVPSMVVVALYAIGVWRTARLVADAAAAPATTFHWAVLILVGWTGVRWRRSARSVRPPSTRRSAGSGRSTGGCGPAS